MKTLLIASLLFTLAAALSDAVIIAAIGGVVSIVSLLITLLVKQKLEKVSTQIDGHMTELLKLKKAEGKEEQRIEAEAEGNPV